MINLNKILVPLDFSQVSMHAFKYAVKLAAKTGASIELLHVVETYKMNVDILDIEDIDDLIEKKAKDKMVEVVNEQNLPSDIDIN
ncbi:MAG: universal stress protein, partial [Bacteroidia bacterium]|nr:universal stress protein [Bacteroidia bacterium]